MNKLRLGINLVLCVLMLGLGGGLVAWMIATRPEPPRRTLAQSLPVVEARQVVAKTFDAPIIGFGNLRAEKQVRVVPNVSGRLIFSHSDLAEGKTIRRGELLFQIDPTIYEAQVESADAKIKGLCASIDRLRAEQETLDEQLDIASKMKVIAEKELQSSKDLQKDIGGVRVNADEQIYLRLAGDYLSLESRRKQIPMMIAETEAKLDAAQATLKQARHDLDSTRIECPFDARVEAVSAHASQYVTALLAIATLTDLEAFEISAAVDPRDLRWIHQGVADAVRELHEGPVSCPQVVVRWSLFGREFEWTGRVTRLERLDEATRMARIAIEIRDVALGLDFQDASGQPPISIGMYCRAEIPSKPIEGALVVPRHAIYENDRVYVFEADPASTDASVGRLGVRHVALLRSVQDQVLVGAPGDGDGKEPVVQLVDGDRVIVSPMVRPVPGMSIRMRDEQVADLTPIPKPDELLTVLAMRVE